MTQSNDAQLLERASLKGGYSDQPNGTIPRNLLLFS